MRNTKLITRCMLAYGLAAICSATPLLAQSTEGVGAVDGAVVDSSGHGIPGVDVFLFGSKHGVRTNAAGAYRIDSVDAGLHIVRFRRLGLRPTTLTVSVGPNDVTGIDVVMPPMPQMLEAVVVQTASGNILRLPKGFAERMKHGMGTYFTSDDIDRLHPLYTSDILHRVAGVFVSQYGLVSSGRGVISLPRAAPPVEETRGKQLSPDVSGTNVGGACGAMPAYLDGTPMGDQSEINLIPPGAISGIEVYKGLATMPLAVVKPSPCGAILIWTK